MFGYVSNAVPEHANTPSNSSQRQGFFWLCRALSVPGLFPRASYTSSRLFLSYIDSLLMFYRFACAISLKVIAMSPCDQGDSHSPTHNQRLTLGIIQVPKSLSSTRAVIDAQPVAKSVLHPHKSAMCFPRDSPRQHYDLRRLKENLHQSQRLSTLFPVFVAQTPNSSPLKLKPISSYEPPALAQAYRHRHPVLTQLSGLTRSPGPTSLCPRRDSPQLRNPLVAHHDSRGRDPLHQHTRLPHPECANASTSQWGRVT